MKNKKLCLNCRSCDGPNIIISCDERNKTEKDLCNLIMKTGKDVSTQTKQIAYMIQYIMHGEDRINFGMAFNAPQDIKKYRDIFLDMYCKLDHQKNEIMYKHIGNKGILKFNNKSVVKFFCPPDDVIMQWGKRRFFEYICYDYFDFICVDFDIDIPIDSNMYNKKLNIYHPLSGIGNVIKEKRPDSTKNENAILSLSQNDITGDEVYSIINEYPEIIEHISNDIINKMNSGHITKLFKLYPNIINHIPDISNMSVNDVFDLLLSDSRYFENIKCAGLIEKLTDTQCADLISAKPRSLSYLSHRIENMPSDIIIKLLIHDSDLITHVNSKLSEKFTSNEIMEILIAKPILMRWFRQHIYGLSILEQEKISHARPELAQFFIKN